MSIIDLLPGDAHLTSLQAGHVLFAQGDQGDLMYVVVEGQVDVLIDGKPVEKVGPGGIIGEMALIDAGRQHPLQGAGRPTAGVCPSGDAHPRPTSAAHGLGALSQLRE